MQVDYTELERRLKSPKNLLNALDRKSVSPQVTPGNGTNKKTGKEETQNKVATQVVLAALARQTNIQEVAQGFRISTRDVKEATNSKSPEVRSKVESTLDRVREIALDRLLSTLGLLDDEKLDKCSARELSSIAANMSRVVEKTTPKELTNQVQLVVYAPQLRGEEQYKTIDI